MSRKTKRKGRNRHRKYELREYFVCLVNSMSDECSKEVCIKVECSMNAVNCGSVLSVGEGKAVPHSVMQFSAV